MRQRVTLTYDWTMCPTAVPTDHWLVTTKFAPAHAPHIGKGRWTMKVGILQDKNLRKTMKEKGINLLEDLKTLAQTRD
jgi:hypothetical protein